VPHVVNGSSSTLRAAGHQVRVDPQRHRWVGVTEDRLYALTRVQAYRSVEVPQRVHPMFPSGDMRLPLPGRRHEPGRSESGLPDVGVEVAPPDLPWAELEKTRRRVTSGASGRFHGSRSRRGLIHRGRPVPYITQWSGERPARLPMVVRRCRIAYADQRPYDRDSQGVLWPRIPSQPGKGRPELGMVHALRQRNAMEQLLCQVCAQPADRNNDGILWLLSEELDNADEDIVTPHPPVCLPCAHASISACPHLRREFTAVRVRACEGAGVRGALYEPADPHPVPVDAIAVAFGNPLINWVRAGQLLLRLTKYRCIELPEDIP
jgi:hypothetical protein